MDPDAAADHAARLLRPDTARRGRRAGDRPLRESVALHGPALAVEAAGRDSATGIPKGRLVQLQRGPQEVERRNEQQYQHALNATASILDDRSILPEWRKQGWLDQHTVAIIAVHGRPWHQVAVTNGSRRALEQLHRRGATVDNLIVPTRFHAQVLMHTVMVRQQAWRVYPVAHRLSVGRTQAWMDDAPAVDLAALAAAMPVRIAHGVASDG